MNENEVTENGMDHYRFQHDGATCHTTLETTALLKELISEYGNSDWPLRSADLTAFDFFFLGSFR